MNSIKIKGNDGTIFEDFAYSYGPGGHNIKRIRFWVCKGVFTAMAERNFIGNFAINNSKDGRGYLYSETISKRAGSLPVDVVINFRSKKASAPVSVAVTLIKWCKLEGNRLGIVIAGNKNNKGE